MSFLAGHLPRRAPLIALGSLALVIAALPGPAAACGPRAAGPSAHTSATASVPGSAIVPGAVNRTSIHLSATYDVRVTLRYETRMLSAVSVMTVRNTSGARIDRVELNSAAARLGRLRFSSVRVDGRLVTPRVSDQTIVVPLGGVLPANATATVRLAFWSYLRTTAGGSDWLFTRTNGIVDAYRWLPWISRPRAFDRPNHGDPFVTPVSPSVRVAITTDRRMGIATGATRVAAAGLTQTFLARNVRDFNFTASPYYSVIGGTAGDTRVEVYYRPGAAASTLLAWAKRALLRYESLVGAYPYPVFRVAESAGGYGMESPGLIWIPRGLSAARIPYLVSHETAHQWFYAVVGNDQASEPYDDEALADFLARYTLGMRRSSRCALTRLDGTIYGYSSTCYYEVVYIQGGNYLDDLRRRMGTSAFFAGLRDYYTRNRFALTGTKPLLVTLDAHTPLDLVPSYRTRFPRYF